MATRGFALISTLAVLILLGLLGVLIMSNTAAELRQSGNSVGLAATREAAEAGQADARFYLVNQGLTAINAILTPYAEDFANLGLDASTTAVIEPSQYAMILSQLNTLPDLNRSGNIGNGSFASSITFSNLTVDPGSLSLAGQDYYMDYVITSEGTVNAFERTVTTTGTFKIRMGRIFLNQFLLLVDDGAASDNLFFATGLNYDGPVHVNEDVAFRGAPGFRLGMTTSASDVSMYVCDGMGGGADQIVNTQSTNCTTPDWGGYGLQYSVPTIDLPENAFSQQRAALGLDVDILTTLTTAEVCTALSSSVPTTCSGSPVAGVYLPTDGAGSLTGGIYVEGDAASIDLSVDISGRQVIEIVDSLGDLYQIIADVATDTTTVQVNGGTVTSYSGVPSGQTDCPGTCPPYPSNGQLFVNGQVQSLRGPTRTGALPSPLPSNSVPSVIPPAIAADMELSVGALGDIVISGDLVYEEDPRMDPTADNVLGLVSGAGDVRLGVMAPDDVYIQAAFLATAPDKGFIVDNADTGLPRGSIHLLGSLAEDKEQIRGVISAIDADGNFVIEHGYGEELTYDQRFLNGGAVPPFFPATTVFQAQASWPNQRSWDER